MARAPLQRFVFAIATVLAFALPARAESPVFRTLGAVEGLPSERVYALAQDAGGYLWIATGDGLARFDGSGFEVYRHRAGDAGSLPANVTQAVHVDATDRLWVGTEGQGVAWRDQTGRFRRWRPVHPDDAIADVWAIGSEPSGRVWFGGFGAGLYRLDPESGAVDRWRADDGSGLASDNVLALAGDGRGRMWIASERGVQVHDGDDFRSFGAAEGVPVGPVYKVLVDGDDILLATSQGPLRGDGERFRPIEGAAGGRALALLDDHAGSFWVGRSPGVERIAGGRSEVLVGRPRERFGPGAASVLDMLRDHEGGIWMATRGAGLIGLPPRWQRFRSWLAATGSGGFAAPSALAFDRAGRLLVADKDAGLFAIAIEDGGLVRLRDGDPPAATRAGAVWPDAGSGIWIGGSFGLIEHMDVGERRWSPQSQRADAPAAGLIDLAVGDGKGGVWWSINGAALEHRSAGGELIARIGEAEGLLPTDSEQLRVDAQQRVWVAGGDGLLRSDASGRRLLPVPGLHGSRVFGFAFVGDDLWLARRGALERYRDGGGEWRMQDSLDLLDGAEVGGLSSDRFGMLWAPTARGLLRIDPQRQRLRRWGVRDGLPGQEFDNRPLAESADGLLAGLLPEAVLLIDPAQFAVAPAPPRIHVEPVRLRRGGEPVALVAGSEVVLDHADRDIVLGGRVLSFADPSQWRFRARLQPFDDDWVDLRDQGSRVFSTLVPGDYRWQLQVAGPDGAWHAFPEVRLAMTPPWWQQTWARLVEWTLLALAVLVLYRGLRWRAERRAATALAESQRRWALRANEQKGRFLATLAHEIRTPMTGLLGMAELLADGPLDPTQQRQLAAMRRSGDVLLRLVNDALDLARIESGHFELRPRALDLPALLRDCLQTVAAAASAKALATRLVIGDEVPRWIEADPERLRQILLNLLGNAIKFTERGEVVLGADCVGDPLRLWVADTGPGLDALQQTRLFRRWGQADGEDTARRYGGSGLGLAICRELAEAMGGTLELDSAPGRGTRIELRMPCRVLPDALPDAETATVAASGTRVLIVEDDAAIAEVLQGLLAAAGCQAAHAAHALDALARIERAPPDVAVLDIDLPGMDGLQLARILRARAPAIALLVLTARSDPQAETAAAEAGAHAFLRKPANAAELLAAIATARSRLN